MVSGQKLPNCQIADRMILSVSYLSVFVERLDLRKTVNDQQTNNHWKPVQQPYYNPDSLANVTEKPRENQNQLHKSRALSDNGEFF